MFETVFVEIHLKDTPRTNSILSKIKYKNITYLEDFQDIWGRVKKPYLQKRETLNLFIADKKGTLVKETPDAYGIGPEKHYYFIHAYNCIYECQYCYLQGYFNTPDIVLFINHDEIINEMQRLVETKGQEDSWFHAGEYSDSLSLTHITNELPDYFNFFRRNQKAKLELRTKSVNIRELLKLTPSPNIYVSFTMGSEEAGKSFDYKCPNIKARLIAIQKLVDHGYKIGLHFDPIIHHEDFLVGYEEIIKKLTQIIPPKQFGYISLGVVRFTKDVYKEVAQNYPESPIHQHDYIKSFDNKIRYNKPMRMWILNSVKELCLKYKIQEDKIYFCMEE